MATGEAPQLLSSRVENILQKVLFGGAVLSMALFLIGIPYALASSSAIDVAQPMSLDSIVSSISSLGAMGLIGLGVLVVIATPMIRIIMTVVYFSRRDKFLTIVPVAVLAIIIFGFLLRVL